MPITSSNKIVDDGQWQRDYERNRLLKKRQKKSEEEKAFQLSQELSLPYMDLNIFPIDQKSINLIKEKEAKNNNLVILGRNNRRIKIGALNPSDEKTQAFVKNFEKENNLETEFFVVSRSSLERAWQQYSNTKIGEKIDFLKMALSSDELKKFQSEVDNLIGLEEQIKKIPTTKIINIVIAGAIKLKASDVHFEPQENEKIRLRYRIDGVLQTIAELPINIYPAVLSRIKMLSDMFINIEDEAQDGRFSVKISENENLDIRSSILPGNFGESIVLRLLMMDFDELKLENLGLVGAAYKRLESSSLKKEGIIINSGPTGSGKTSTLYSLINRINSPEKKIITIEDPVEYKLPGVVQTQVNKNGDYTFEKGLRAVVRQDPDIILVGEIRDDSTAEVATQAALTGHLVLTTVHANSSAGVVSRMLDLGVETNQIASAINVVIGQRLVRRLCPHCREEYIPAQTTVESFKKILAMISPKAKVEIPNKIEKLWRPKGCLKCNGLGYKGRIGIFEVFEVTDSIRKKIVDLATENELMQQALEEGMVTLIQDGIVKALKGETSMEEIQRVLGGGEYLLELYEKIMVQVLSNKITIKDNAYEVVKAESDKNSDNLNQKSAKELLEIILLKGMMVGAGDIHIEPGEKSFKVRFRVDGVLQNAYDLPMSMFLGVLNEIKNIVGITTENRQSGTLDNRFSVDLSAITELETDKIDIRLSMILGGYGDIIVMRLLNKSAQAINLEQMNLNPINLEKIKREAERANGIIINTGPTGSGKTTTLYSLLSYLNKPEVKIITVEDPIEYQINGVIQTQINKEEKYDFPVAMRSLLRQNPDIMLIGEIRDEESADLAYKAALTGHLVLTTLHANSASGSVQRLLNMGIDISDIASGTNCFMAQRLVRELCPKCKKKVLAKKEERDIIEKAINSISSKINLDLKIPENLYEAVGCPHCNGTGFKGRIPILEILLIGKEMEKFLVNNPTESEIEEKAVEDGMLTMFQDGVVRVLLGQTTLEEILREAD
jgi:type II secretory ATPase GspE/PulE/Tfp pilus assembly ATPase PilB-like protein